MAGFEQIKQYLNFAWDEPQVSGGAQESYDDVLDKLDMSSIPDILEEYHIQYTLNIEEPENNNSNNVAADIDTDLESTKKYNNIAADIDTETSKNDDVKDLEKNSDLYEPILDDLENLEVFDDVMGGRTEDALEAIQTMSDLMEVVDEPEPQMAIVIPKGVTNKSKFRNDLLKIVDNIILINSSQP